jgi:hypothetical protein
MNGDYQVWRDEIAGVLDQRRYPVSWLDREVISGRVLVWAVADAIILAEIRSYPSGAADIHGLVAAGNAETIINDLIPQAERYGRDWGCLAAVIESREGWQRALKPSGYELYQTALRKDL